MNTPAYTCSGCRFWRPADGSAQTGLCRRRAPTYHDRWATTAADDSCGEHPNRDSSGDTLEDVLEVLGQIRQALQALAAAIDYGRP